MRLLRRLQVVDKAGLDAVVERLGDDNARVQAAFLNLINMALLHPSQRLLKALETDVDKVLQQVCEPARSRRSLSSCACI